MIKYISFDLWNTLISNIDYTTDRMQILQKYLEKINHISNFHELKEIYQTAVHQNYLAEGRTNYEHIYATTILDYMFDKLSVSFPSEYIPLLIKEWEEIMLTKLPSLKPGVEEMLPNLSQNYGIAMISDTGITPGSIIRDVFEKFTLKHYFDIMVFSNETGVNKPHELPFQNILSHFNAQPEEIVHVGDLLHTDILGAKKAGLYACWIVDESMLPIDIEKQEYSRAEVKPDFVIHSLLELPKVLNSH